MGLSLILAAVGAALASGILVWLYVGYKTRRKVDYMLDALADGELNFRFDTGKLLGRGMNHALNRLRGIFEQETRQIREKEHYYRQMLDLVNTGVVAYEADSKRVIYSNAAASSLLGVVGLRNLRQLDSISHELYESVLKVPDGGKGSASCYDESSLRRLSVSAALSRIEGKDVRIVSLDDVTGLVETAESESWTRLIRVLTHEIMNTVTPIASLSEALSQVSSPSELSSGLETISASSRGLIKFVESYRSLTRVAVPVKSAFYVKELVQNVLELTSSAVSSSGAQAQYHEKSEAILLYADKGQISQILINLIKNALQAGARHIGITASLGSRENVTIEVTNDGAPISSANKEEIFVPFYTTKSDGTGIGLSLSRQIMRLHGGALTLVESSVSQTTFALIFS